MCFDRVADTYDTSRPPARPEVVEALAKELSDCSSVLELGVGTGRLALPLLERGIPVVGIDLSRKMLDLSRAKGMDRLVVGDACQLPFRPQSFDAVLAVHVLHLIKSLRAVLSETGATARKKLVCIVTRHEPPVEGISTAYRRAIERHGLASVRRRQDAELEIADVIRPRRFETVVRYEEVEKADAALRALRQKLWTMTWGIPDDVHNAVVDELAKRFGGTTVALAAQISLLSWDVADFTQEALERMEQRDSGRRSTEGAP